jgi:hypothetical protein
VLRRPLPQKSFLRGIGRSHNQAQSGEQIARFVPAMRWHAPASQAEVLTSVGTGWNPHPDLTARGRHFNRASENGFLQCHGQHQSDFNTVTLKERMG